MDPKIAAMLAAAGRTVDSFPSDFSKALLAGKVRGCANAASDVAWLRQL